ncbi:MAG: glycoside hydrolase domain-containing protein, partial [Bacteroidota bacterium]
MILSFSCNKTIEEEKNKQKNNLQYVNPNIGAVGHLLHPTYPTVHLPNQPIRMIPVRKDYLDDQISFFSLSMISHREGYLFGILPGMLISEGDIWAKKQTYDHDHEILKPNYYKTYLIDSEITTEFVPGKRAGFFKFHFPEKGTKKLKLHVNNEGYWKKAGENSIIGVEKFKGMKAYVYGEFNGIPELEFDSETIHNKKKNTSREQANAWITFPESENKSIEFKYAISYLSAEQAQKNLHTEIPQWDFKKIKDQSTLAWNKKLGQIKVEGGTEAQRNTFYTSLYRYYERMVNITEGGYYFSAYDHQIHSDTTNFYVDDWAWDTYLTQHPLRMILSPGLEADMLQSYVRMYGQSGWIPQFPLLHG